MAYEGPNVKVIQSFEPTPAAQSPEDLPVALAGSLYTVYSGQVLGSFLGMFDTELDFVKTRDTDVVIYEASQNQRVYDRMRPRFFANSGSSELIKTGTEAPTSSGVTMKFGTDFDTTDTYTATVFSGRGAAWFPMFVTASASASPYTVSGTTITIAGASLKSISGIVAGLPVYGFDGTSTWKLVGTTASTPDSETSIRLAGVATDIATYLVDVVIGFNPSSGKSNSYITYLYDANANFTRDCKRGDIVDIVSSDAVSGTLQKSSIVSISGDGKMLQLAVGATIGDILHSGKTGVAALSGQAITNLFTNSATAATKIRVSAYATYRLVGFTKKFDTSTVVVTPSTDNILTIDDDMSFAAGDVVVMRKSDHSVIKTTTIVGPGTTSKKWVVVDNVTADTAEIVVWDMSDIDNIRSGNTVTASYRCARVDLVGQVLNGDDDIAVITTGETADLRIFNDLGQMFDLVKARASGKKIYFTTVDPTVDPAAAYEAALELYNLRDVYEPICGSDEVAVMSLLPGNVLAQSDPYEAHERISVQSFNKLDVFGITIHTGSVTTDGIVTCAGADLVAEGVGIGDQISIRDVKIGGIVTLPGDNFYTISSVNGGVVHTDYVGDVIASTSVRFLAGANSKKAVYAANNIGAANERRITGVFPCSFKAYINAVEYELPSFFLTAVVAGLDAGQKVSQSQTRLNTQLPWTCKLDTNFVFRKSDLDVIGGAGVYIFMQPQALSPVVYSRHDLTTNMDALEYKERSITKQADKSAKFLRSIVDPYVGRYNITPELLKFLNMILSAGSDALVKGGVVQSCSINSVTRDPNIADKILINITIVVFVAGNYYEITLNVRSR